MKLTTLCAALVVLHLQAIHAQIDPSEIIAGSAQDASYLGSQYFFPLANSLAYGLNNGWYQTAEARSGGSFSLLVTPSIIYIPKDERSFVIDESKLKNLELADPADNVAPTVFGLNEVGPQLRYKDAPGQKINTPPGLNVNYNIVPMLQASVGLVANTEISLRYMPPVNVLGERESELKVFGLGIQHDILQWLSADEDSPWHASAFFGYTNVSFRLPLDEGQAVKMTSNGVTARESFRAIGDLSLPTSGWVTIQATPKYRLPAVLRPTERN
ncbi:MAG: DUF6588 family protein [Owenweeksia sp.]|nr:DUF6588 family protein [Owenweeksia sp.]